MKQMEKIKQARLEREMEDSERKRLSYEEEATFI